MARNTRLRIAQILLVGPLGALVVGAALVFSLIAPPEPVEGIDWLVAAWAVVSGGVNVAAGLRLGRDWPASRRLALTACSNYAAFSLVKLVGYGEGTAVPFLAATLVVAALVGLRGGRAVARVSYANIVSTVALFVVLGGVSVAAVKLPHASVGAPQLKANAVNTKKVRDGSLTAADFAQGQLPGAPTGERGPAGPQGPAGATGVQGPRGEQGEPGPLVRTLPSGETLTGMYGFGGSVSGASGGAERTSITFAFPLAADIDGSHVHVVARTDAATGECPGSLSTPTAAPGHLCIYNGGPYAPTPMNPFDSSSGEASRFGAQLQISRPDAGLLTGFGSWAVTAP